MIVQKQYTFIKPTYLFLTKQHRYYSQKKKNAQKNKFYFHKLTSIFSVVIPLKKILLNLEFILKFI